MKIQNGQYLSALQIQDQFLKPTNASTDIRTSGQGLSFRDILSEKTEETASGLRFSKHAASRLANRNIRLTDDQIERLSDGTQKAGAKGIRDSLVIVDQLAFIVNVPNQTVVTAMDQTETDANIFTNIDGAVIM